MQRLHNLVDLERRVRDETTKSLMKMFEDLSAKLTHDVEVCYADAGMGIDDHCRWNAATASRQRMACYV